MVRTFIEQVDGTYMGIGLHIEDELAFLEIASTGDLKKTQEFITLSGEWYSLSGCRTNLVNPFRFIRFFREK